MSVLTPPAPAPATPPPVLDGSGISRGRKIRVVDQKRGREFNEGRALVGPVDEDAAHAQLERAHIQHSTHANADCRSEPRVRPAFSSSRNCARRDSFGKRCFGRRDRAAQRIAFRGCAHVGELAGLAVVDHGQERDEPRSAQSQLLRVLLQLGGQRLRRSKARVGREHLVGLSLHSTADAVDQKTDASKSRDRDDDRGPQDGEFA